MPQVTFQSEDRARPRHGLRSDTLRVSRPMQTGILDGRKRQYDHAHDGLVLPDLSDVTMRLIELLYAAAARMAIARACSIRQTRSAACLRGVRGNISPTLWPVKRCFCWTTRPIIDGFEPTRPFCSRSRPSPEYIAITTSPTRVRRQRAAMRDRLSRARSSSG